jgi:hypothetical protein
MRCVDACVNKGSDNRRGGKWGQHIADASSVAANHGRRFPTRSWICKAPRNIPFITARMSGSSSSLRSRSAQVNPAHHSLVYWLDVPRPHRRVSSPYPRVLGVGADKTKWASASPVDSGIVFGCPALSDVVNVRVWCCQTDRRANQRDDQHAKR